MNESLLRFDKRQKYLVFDTETEGLNLVDSRPWQIAWIVAQGGKIIQKHDIYVRWDDLNVSKDAARVTGFSKDIYERTAIDAEYSATQYQRDRTTFTDSSTIYASIGDQLDMLYHDLVAGKLDATGTWAKHITGVKDANPKPS